MDDITYLSTNNQTKTKRSRLAASLYHHRIAPVYVCEGVCHEATCRTNKGLID
jgi:hypothetical protein